MTTKIKNDTLSFRISSGLKNIIGRDLISDKYIAVFELVKNAYDAKASKVNISFVKSDKNTDRIIISDNGSGMTYDDIVEKWLFVAYSEKKPQNRQKSDFRDDIKRELAGAKGVGRFSCDRLGSTLTLITKTANENAAKITNAVKMSYLVRTASVVVTLVIAFITKQFNILATVIPLLCMRPILTVSEMLKNKGGVK